MSSLSNDEISTCMDSLKLAINCRYFFFLLVSPLGERKTKRISPSTQMRGMKDSNPLSPQWGLLGCSCCSMETYPTCHLNRSQRQFNSVYWGSHTDQNVASPAEDQCMASVALLVSKQNIFQDFHYFIIKILF